MSTSTKSAKKPVTLIGDNPPDRISPFNGVMIGFTIAEIVAMWQLTQLAPSWWLRILAWVLLALAITATLLRPKMWRKSSAVHAARWRALRRASRIEAADVADQAPADPAERLAFTVGVTAVLGHIADIVSDEERRAARDLEDKTT